MTIKECFLTEGVKYFKLSDRIKKVLRKVKDAYLDLPGKNETDAEMVIKALETDILKQVIKIEKNYEYGHIGKKEAVEQLNKLNPKFEKGKKLLKDDGILPSINFDWLNLLNFIMWAPWILAGKTFYDIFIDVTNNGKLNITPQQAGIKPPPQ